MIRPGIGSLYAGYRQCRHQPPQQRRRISSTPHLASWMDRVKAIFTGQKPSETFNLLSFANELSNARKVSNWKQYVVGRSSDATFAEAFAKKEAILRCLGGFDNTGENLRNSQKQEAAKLCKCTIAEVENALAMYTWAKEAQKKIERLKEEGKPMPKSMSEIQQLMGSTPMDLARSNLAKSGQMSRNAPCPCGSNKRYKRCCGKD
ncbi:unnamed protein product [Cuscuta campestris]|uniref:SecA Wing/Scaffold domain-containing protein n=2 Tax=Cuscuta sect. Cleistogrammica TaxID=1824901 RepID=A0A484KBY7_9ASTE|nr:hypothetical protein DM860_016930 [Cuscuta australis]VFQ60439.1 unnamed protein product [Cuscuta campestris]